MAPDWYYVKDGQRGLFVVYDDAKGSCRKRRFVANDGEFVDQTPSVPGDFAHVFRAEFRNANRLGELRGWPNLEAAVKAGKLPNDVLGELKGLVRAIHGISE